MMTKIDQQQPPAPVAADTPAQDTQTTAAPKQGVIRHIRLFNHRNKNRKAKGAMFGIWEVLMVMVIGAVLLAGSANNWADAFKMADSDYIWNVSQRLGNNWKLITQKCNVSSELGTSDIVTSPSVANHLMLLVEGTGVNPSYQGCFQSVGLEPVRNASVKGNNGVYQARGYTVTISNVTVNNRNRVAVTLSNVEDQTVLELVQAHGAQAGSSTFTTLPSDDTTDPVVRFSASGTGFHNVTIIV